MATGEETLDAARQLQGLGLIPQNDEARMAWATAVAGLTQAQIKAGLRWAANFHGEKGYLRPATFMHAARDGARRGDDARPWWETHRVEIGEDAEGRPVALCEEYPDPKGGPALRRPVLIPKEPPSHDREATRQARARFYREHGELAGVIENTLASTRAPEPKREEEPATGIPF